jgi:hypothetical protein
MTSPFVSLPAPASPATVTPQDTILGGGGWWPDIDLMRFRDEMRVDDSVTLGRVRAVIVTAFLAVTRELFPERQKLQLAGADSLANAPGDKVDGANAYEHAFRRAVFSLAKAELVEKYRDIDTTRQGDDRADRLDPSAEDHMRNARHALSDFRGDGRAVVELI